MSRRWLRTGLAAALALAASVGGTVAAIEAGPATRAAASLEPAIEPAAPGGKCVADPAFMRRNHMDMLRHQRDETVHQGIRGASPSLQGCIACHASAKTGSVAQARTDFCVGCHSYAAVQIDCFDCHSSKPAQRTAAASTGAAQ